MAESEPDPIEPAIVPRGLAPTGPRLTLRPLLEMVLGVALAITFTLAAQHLAWIGIHINEYVLIVLILLVSIGLYAIRYVFRVAYGFLEILIGLLAILGTINRSPQTISDPLTANLLIVQTAAGIYIIVRGIDNVAQVEPFANTVPIFKAFWRSLRNKS